MQLLRLPKASFICFSLWIFSRQSTQECIQELCAERATALLFLILARPPLFRLASVSAGSGLSSLRVSLSFLPALSFPSFETVAPDFQTPHNLGFSDNCFKKTVAFAGRLDRHSIGKHSLKLWSNTEAEYGAELYSQYRQVPPQLLQRQQHQMKRRKDNACQTCV